MSEKQRGGGSVGMERLGIVYSLELGKTKSAKRRPKCDTKKNKSEGAKTSLIWQLFVGRWVEDLSTSGLLLDLKPGQEGAKLRGFARLGAPLVNTSFTSRFAIFGVSIPGSGKKPSVLRRDEAVGDGVQSFGNSAPKSEKHFSLSGTLFRF